MIEEQAFVPFQVSDLPEGPWLVFAPHADDETFGMGGSILRARDEGIAVDLIVVTDGALGGDREDLVAVRRREVEQVSAVLGIRRLRCWNEPDRGVALSDRLVASACAAICELQPATVFFPASYEPHPDHRATARVVWAALARLLLDGERPLLDGERPLLDGEREEQGEGRRPKPPVPMSYEIGVQSPINTMIDITAVMPEKQQVMQLYNSQNTENDYPDLVSSLDQARTFSLPEPVRYAEAYFRFPPEAPREPLRAWNDRYYEQYWQ